MSAPPRRSIRLHVGLQVVAVFILVVAANYFSYNHYARADFSRSQKFVLADQTKRVIRELIKPVHITVVFSPTSTGPESVLFDDVRGLLKELIFSGRKKIEVEEVDPNRNLSRARELQAKYKFNADENVIVLDYEGRTQFVPVANMGDFDLAAIMAGEPPRLLSFKGEQVLTNAMLALVSPEKKKFYFLQGHGEPAIGGSSPLGIWQDYLSRQNANVVPLSLGAVDQIPADCGALAIIAPQGDLTEREARILSQYWASQQGRLLVLLDPNHSVPRLNGVLQQAGITPLNNRVLRIVRLPFATGILREVTGEFLPGNSITKRLINMGLTFPGATQSLDVDQEAGRKENIQLWPLIQAEEAFWGESDYVTDETKGVRYDEGRDVGQPVYLAAAAARGGVNDDRIEVESSKLVVVGSSDFALDTALQKQKQSLDFLLSASNWLLDRNQLTGVMPKSITNFTLNLSDAELRSIVFYTMIVMPGFVALVGLVVWLRRRA